MSEWISVDRELPELGEQVLVWFGCECMVCVLVWDKDGLFWEDPLEMWAPIADYEFWMPLPKPPGEEGE